MSSETTKSSRKHQLIKREIMKLFIILAVIMATCHADVSLLRGIGRHEGYNYRKPDVEFPILPTNPPTPPNEYLPPDRPTRTYIPPSPQPPPEREYLPPQPQPPQPEYIPEYISPPPEPPQREYLPPQHHRHTQSPVQQHQIVLRRSQPTFLNHGFRSLPQQQQPNIFRLF